MKKMHLYDTTFDYLFDLAVDDISSKDDTAPEPIDFAVEQCNRG